MPDPALDQLVAALLEGTREGTIVWREVTGDGNSFITTRRSGTVVVERKEARVQVGGALVRLTVQDQLGEPITVIDSPTIASTVAGSPSSEASRQLPTLFDVVGSKHTGNHAALQKLISEFRDQE